MLLRSALFSFALPFAVVASSLHGHVHGSRHQEIAKRQSGEVELHKRFSSTRWTFYDVGLGACGKHNVENDFIVALNSAQYGGGYPGPHCFKTITMNYNGKSAQATIMDECPGCPFGGLDLSRGLFRHFASESLGVLTGEWSFNDGSGSPPPPPPPPPKPKPTTSRHTEPQPKPTPKPEPKPEPSTTHKAETTTFSPKPKPSSSSSSVHSSSSSTLSKLVSTSSKASSSVPSSLAPVVAPAPTPVREASSNLQNINQAFLNLGGLAVAAAV